MVFRFPGLDRILSWVDSRPRSGTDPPCAPGDLSRVLAMLSPQGDYFTAGDAVQNCLITGSIGSGKTTGSGELLALEYLRAGWGGLVLTTKRSDVSRWLDYCKMTNRLDSVVIFTPDNGCPYRFNFLEYEHRQGGKGLVDNLASTLFTVFEVSGRLEQTSTSGDAGFFEDNAKDVTYHALALEIAATGNVSLPNAKRIIESAPRSPEQVKDKEWARNSLCFKRLIQAQERCPDPALLESLASYWLTFWPGLGDRTRSSIEATLFSRLNKLIRGVNAELFNGSTSNFVPEMTHHGAVCIVDMPLKLYGEAGLFAQTILKLFWQKSMERRVITQDTVPSFLFIDESHLFITSNDLEFLTTSREARAACVFLTQSRSNYEAMLKGANVKARVDALLSCFQTKIFHQCQDTAHNLYASDLIGRVWTPAATYGTSHNPQAQPPSLFSDHPASTSTSIAEQYRYLVEPREFTQLKKPAADNVDIEAILFKGGEVFKATGKPFLKLSFRQRR